MAQDDAALVQSYLRVATLSSLPLNVNVFIPTPSNTDYTFGEITRYFVQQVNQPNGEITEVSKQTFQALQDVSLYRTVALRWKISGLATDVFDTAGRVERPGIETANKASIKNAAKTMPAITRKLTNVFQLWKKF